MRAAPRAPAVATCSSAAGGRSICADPTLHSPQPPPPLVQPSLPSQPPRGSACLGHNAAKLWRDVRNDMTAALLSSLSSQAISAVSAVSAVKQNQQSSSLVGRDRD